MSYPLVSIGLPVYNAGPYVSEAIKSILLQTYKKFELIIINDGSTDDSLTKINKFNDYRIKIINQNNQGLISSLNTSITNSNGYFYMRHDADDISDPYRLEKMIEFIHNNQLDYCGSYVYLWFPNTNKKILYKPPTDEFEIKNKILSGVPGFVHPSCLFRKEILHEIGLYREGFLHMEDVDLFARLLSYKSGNYDKPLYFLRRDNLNSISEVFSYNQFVNSKTYVEIFIKKGIPDYDIFYEKSMDNKNNTKYKINYMYHRYIRKLIIKFVRNVFNLIKNDK